MFLVLNLYCNILFNKGDSKMQKNHKLITLITIVLFTSAGTAIASDKGKGKGHGVGGVAADHISEQGAEHRQYNAGGVSEQHKKEFDDELKHKMKDKEKDLKEHKDKKEKKAKKSKDKHEKEMKDKERDDDNDGVEKTNRRWWQLFGGEDSDS